MKSVRFFSSVWPYSCVSAAIALVVAAVIMDSTVASADSITSSIITLNVDTNRSVGNGAGNVSVAPNTVSLVETNANEYTSAAGKKITLTVRPGYQFDPTSTVSAISAGIGFNGVAANNAASVTPTGAADETITFNLTSGGSAGLDSIVFSGIKIRIISAAGAAGPSQATILLTTSTAGGIFTNTPIVAASITKGAPDHLVFSAQPGTTQSGLDLFPAVKIVDFGENVVTTVVRTITLAIQTNPGGATLNGTLSHNTIAGVSTWTDPDDLIIVPAATGYTLRASHSAGEFLTSDTVDSLPFDILAGAPDHLTVSLQPVDTVAGDDIIIQVSLFDTMNNLVTASPVNVTLDAAVNPGGWPLLTASSLTKMTVNGVASWSAADDLRITKAVANYQLAASGIGSPVLSDPFDIIAGSPSSLQFVQEPSNVVQNETISPPVTVRLLDAFGNLTNSSIGVTLVPVGATCGGALSGGSVNSSAGLATFDNLSFDTACDDVTLLASSSGLVSTTSGAFNVTAAAGGTPDPMNGADACGTCGTGAAATLVPVLLAPMIFRRRRR